MTISLITSLIWELLSSSMKRVFFGFVLCFFALFTIADGQESLEVADRDEESIKELLRIPRIDYPEDLPIDETPWVLMELHVATVRAPDSTWSGMRKVSAVDSAWKHAKEGDDIYDVTDWFLTAKQKKLRKDKKNRWVYYNKTSGYIIAHADLFLKSTIQTFAWHSMALNGYYPRLQLMYLDVDDKVELEFGAIQESRHRVLFRNTMSINSKTSLKCGVGGSSYGVELVDIIPEYDRRLYSFILKMNAGEQMVYENRLFLVPNRWVIHECGISAKGKRKVLAIKVDHVSHFGEVLTFPVDDNISETNFVRTSSEDEGHPFGERFQTVHTFYRVPADMFHAMGSDDDDDYDPFAESEDERELPNMKNVSEILSLLFRDLEGYYFNYQNLFLLKSSEGGRLEFDVLMADLELRKKLPLVECRLLFYEIDFYNDYAARSWKVEDVLSGNPVKLGSMGSMLDLGGDAVMKYGDDDCVLSLYYPQTKEAQEKISDERMLEWKLNLSSMDIEDKNETRVRIGEAKVICLGKNVENGKLRMMVINLSELASNK